MAKVLSFFDIDETVFHSFAKVIVRNKHTGEIVDELPNDEFNSHVLGDDEEYDFSQFKDAKLFKVSSKVINSTLRELKRQFSKGNMIIFLTARADMDSNATFKDAFRQVGIRVNDKRVRFELAGNLKYGPIPQRKMYIIGRYLKKFKQVEEVNIYDDHKENVRILDQVAKSYPDVRFNKYLIKNGKIIDYGKLNEMKSFKEHLTEEQELEEIFGSIPFAINTLKWQSKHRGQKPKGKDNWKFDYLLPVRDAGLMFSDDGEYSFTGEFKKAVKGLVNFLKRRASGKANLKQAKVTLQP